MSTFTRRFARVLIDNAKLQASHHPKRCISTKKTVIPCASLSTAREGLQQANPKAATQGVHVSLSPKVEDALQITFEDGKQGTAPFYWLRDNCNCSSCFDKSALGRKFILDGLKWGIKPTHVETSGGQLSVAWDDGHEGQYDLQWIKNRSFTESDRKEYRKVYKLPQVLWGKDLKLDTFDYSSLFSNETLLLEYLTTLESKGVVLIKNTPLLEDSGPKLIDHIAFVKQCHFGRRSPVKVRQDPNNLAWTNSKLGLHNDLAQYDHQAGIIYIHMIQQHRGKGGESLVSDGNYCAELMKENYPEEFKTLTNTDVYFWDKGTRSYYLEMESFYKMHKGPVIQLDNNGHVIKVSVNNAVRDSHLDIPPEKVNNFYKAMKVYYDLLYENSFAFKMENGDMLNLDNVRCQHGRESFEENSDRHIESSYLDWDEARCKRRQLQEKFNLI